MARRHDPFPVQKKRIVAKLLWYSPAETSFHGRGRFRSFSINGKGFGMLQDAEGNSYFVYGNELGGGSYGEDADKTFLKLDHEYVITTCWVTPEGYQPPPYHDFFMGTKARVRSIETKSGRKPSKSRIEKALVRRNICIELERSYFRRAA